ncbi:TPA: RelA/SpoT domain-containing protein [Yersinia enterocolitica]|nr:(p)ppGpp synthetase [Yersinia enterocolitica]HDL8228746.1 RelA/SpoT domain-containing protein [Yersinia enterocolitica]HEI6973623.1 RelA/SpoT domain-containing protein [Yersinia enterocolitica]HEN3265391.1 RelA/SpoT domain-containing protein [Yersinia enterocolitica]
MDLKMVELRFSNKQINRAGSILRDIDGCEMDDLIWALEALNNLREMYVHPLNAFQTTLRRKMKAADQDGVASQRLKRIPSIISKLNRSPGMKLARMQDLGGLRAVVKDIVSVRELEESYVNNGQNRFKHELKSQRDYINQPKDSGYRGIHLVYQYQGSSNPHHNGLLLEIQIRTKLQHAWATAVETMGTFVGQSIKSSEADTEWNDYFSLVGSAFALMEGCPPVEAYTHMTKLQTYKAVVDQTEKLQVIDKLLGFRSAIKDISESKNSGSYHLIVLDTLAGTVDINSFGLKRINEATTAYIEWETDSEQHPHVQVVLVSTESIGNLKAAYPSYFLDAGEFVKYIREIQAECL